MVDYLDFEIQVDDRERKIIPLFETCKNTKNITITVKRLTVGDYAYVYKGNILAIIERKSWVDLAASIKDGRKDNISKMIDVRNETKCTLVYLMEGSLFRQPQTKIARIPFKALRSHVDHLSIRDNVIIIYSKDFRGSADRIIDFAENMCTLPSIISIEGGDSTTENLLTISRTKTDDTIKVSIWKSIEGVTNNTYDILIENFRLQDMMLSDIETEKISVLKYKSGNSLGEFRAKKILKSAKSIDTWKKMLSKIPGITLETSNKILKLYMLDSIMRGDISVEQLAKIQKTEKRKVGKSDAIKILHFFLKEPDTRAENIVIVERKKEEDIEDIVIVEREKEEDIEDIEDIEESHEPNES